MRRTRPVNVYVHPALFEKMEKIRTIYRERWGINLTQKAQTAIIARTLDLSKLPKVDLIGGKNVKKKR